MNDVAVIDRFLDVFSRYIEAVGREGDVLLGLSTSGNSANIIFEALGDLCRFTYVIVLL